VQREPWIVCAHDHVGPATPESPPPRRSLSFQAWTNKREDVAVDDAAARPWLPSRNEVYGFAERTRRNLDFIREAHSRGQPGVHVVTQAVLSLLGIVVFPYEDALQSFHTSWMNEDLRNLGRRGWPIWEQSGYRANTLKHLVYRMRNATAHSGVRFDSDSDRPEDVRVQFDCTVKDSAGQLQNWRGSIAADRLIEWCQCFLKHVEDAVG
jgi:hypothetical protein